MQGRLTCLSSIPSPAVCHEGDKGQLQKAPTRCGGLTHLLVSEPPHEEGKSHFQFIDEASETQAWQGMLEEHFRW